MILTQIVVYFVSRMPCASWAKVAVSGKCGSVGRCTGARSPKSRNYSCCDYIEDLYYRRNHAECSYVARVVAGRLTRESWRYVTNLIFVAFVIISLFLLLVIICGRN